MKRKHFIMLVFILTFNFAYANSSDLEDKISDVISWIILIVMPIVGIYLFWQLHIIPEKIAEKNNHPQLNAIKALTLLSLFFGGLLWPFAIVWANYKYSNVSYPDKESEEKKKKIMDGLNERLNEENPKTSSTTEVETDNSSEKSV